MTYPKPVDDSGDDIPGLVGKKTMKNWLKTQDPDVVGSSGENPAFTTTPSASRIGSLPPRSPPTTTKSEDEEISESESDDSDEESEEEENADECSFDKLANKQSGWMSHTHFYNFSDWKSRTALGGRLKTTPLQKRKLSICALAFE
ncbi:unnamed protein product [Gongylonema pulchrum]|uniref:Uncharacterized protein n=1 Tax=Gongylonema pulchrum TaxID=637853 RepID=A0A183EE13_9BILA|nr:unnamed protein product [Gongylonema pulchrum]